MNNYLDYLNISNDKLDKFAKYYNLLVLENENINLTAITKIDEVYIKHFYDSLLLDKCINLNNQTLLDVGSGAGFPSIPLKICYPNLKITIIEPTTKKIKFLERLINELELKDVILINDRAEVAIKERYEKYDIVTARAVASLPILMELCIPFLKVKGNLYALKGSKYKEEIDISTNALKELNCDIKEVKMFDLPFEYGQRSIIIINKFGKTNKKYPRLYKDIKKKSL